MRASYERMRKTTRTLLIASLLVSFGSGCQLYNSGTEVRMDEQMLNITFENAKAEEVFDAIIHGTERETRARG